VVGVRVRLEHADDPYAALLRLREVVLDPVRRVDDNGGAPVGASDQIGGAAEVVIDELPEDH